MVDEVAIIGVGMHPWGKWGRNFVEYGVAAIRDAVVDAGIAADPHRALFGELVNVASTVR